MPGFLKVKLSKEMSPPVDLVSQGADFIGCAYHLEGRRGPAPLLRIGKGNVPQGGFGQCLLTLSAVPTTGRGRQT